VSSVWVCAAVAVFVVLLIVMALGVYLEDNDGL
jgi:hypothetical protein